MTSVLQYINAGKVSGGAAATTIPAQWCRPAHKPTCCIAIQGSGSCCMCVPATATCFIIEIWSQGGGGAGGCCCGVGSYGGQGGAYGWVACTTSATNHILCACMCMCGSGYCGCSICSICSGNTGQFSYVCDCSTTVFWCLCGGCGGCWCCNPTAPNSTPWCWSGSTNQASGYFNPYNLYNVCKCFSATLAGTGSASSSSGSSLQFCCTDPGNAGPAIQSSVWAGCTSCAAPSAPVGGSWSGWNSTFPVCACTCFSSPYIWQGACGWSDANGTPWTCANNFSANIVNALFCGGGAGIGGASYAGADQAWYKCAFGCSSCWQQAGNFPGGGGMSSYTASAWGQPGGGTAGQILMSYC